MTPQELKQQFNEAYGLKQYPVTFEVDAVTYANICQHIFWVKRTEINGHVISVCVGKNGGIMFNGVELLLKND